MRRLFFLIVVVLAFLLVASQKTQARLCPIMPFAHVVPSLRIQKVYTTFSPSPDMEFRRVLSKRKIVLRRERIYYTKWVPR